MPTSTIAAKFRPDLAPAYRISTNRLAFLRIASGLKYMARGVFLPGGTSGRVAPRAATADEGLGRVDQAQLGKMPDCPAGVLDVAFAPAQHLGAACQYFDCVAALVDGDHRRWADRRGGHCIDALVIQGQATEPRVCTGIAFHFAAVAAQPQFSEAVLEPAGQIAGGAEGQPSAGAQLPRSCGVVCGCGGQTLPVSVELAPGLPETVAIGKAVQAALLIEAGLLQGFVLRGDAAYRAPGARRFAFPAHQAGDGPGLRRPVPLDPGQAASIVAQCGGGIEVGAFCQDLSMLCGETHKAMLDLLPVVFLDGQNQARMPLHITVAAVVSMGEPATCLVVAPMPDPTSAIGRPELVPEHTVFADLQFGEVGPGGHRLGGAELSRGQ
ncbi:hypothetical protein WR25_12018 [Diploscapter pachys]|uniref:Uncharacterized protein n=1 Tax=Diploscapter pachys TaxID=2018661 RepID=A0A2A2KKT0_9BILA|nr:hypothetical protein WR25_12018 [Diploscapter pachys]